MKETGVGSLIRATSFWRRAEFQRGCMVYSVAMILTCVGSTMFLLWAPRMTSNELPPSVQWAAVKIQSEAMMVAPQNHELSTTRATCLPFEFLSLIFKPMKFDYIFFVLTMGIRGGQPLLHQRYVPIAGILPVRKCLCTKRIGENCLKRN